MYQIVRLGPNASQVEYRLADECGQENEKLNRKQGVGQVRYRAPGHYGIERVGSGWSEFGRTPGTVLQTDADYDEVRAITSGRHPLTGEVLLKPKVAAHPASRLSGRIFLENLKVHAQTQGMSPADLMSGNKRAAKRLGTLESSLVSKGETYRVPVQDLEHMATIAGLPLEQVYPAEELRQAREHAEARVRVGNRGYDWILTRPRSHLWEEFTSERMRARLAELWMESVRSGAHLLERWCSYGMSGHHGDGQRAERVESTGWAATITWHRTTRPIDGGIGDPHSHAHVMVPNLVYCPSDQTWRAPAGGGYDLYRHCAAASEYVLAHYRNALAREFGVRHEYQPATKQWEVAGVPSQLRRHFTRRSQQVDNHVGEDVSSAQDRRVAGRQTAEPKVASTPREERAFWRDRAKKAGWVPEHVVRAVLGYEPPEDGLGPGGLQPPQQPDPGEVAAKVWSPEDGVTSSEKETSLPKIMAKVAQSCPDGVENAEELEDLTSRVVRDQQAKPLPGPRSQHLSNTDRYTSTDIEEAERELVTEAQERTREETAVVEEYMVQEAIEEFARDRGYRLSGEQEQVVRRLAQDGYGIDALIGEAGSGKTTVMDAVHRAWAKAGISVHGAATAAVAAVKLRAESRIHGATVASWQHKVNTGEGLEGVGVLILEEAAMLDDRALRDLALEARRTGTKLVMIGDPKQFRAIGVGGAFKRIHEIVDGPSLTENYRQLDSVERMALSVWRTENRAATLDLWANTGHIQATQDLNEAYAFMVSDWWGDWARHHDLHDAIENALLLAPTHRDVAELNARARVLARQAGMLEEAEYTFALLGGEELPVAVGDVVRVRKNDYRENEEDVLNGYRGVAREVDPSRGVRVEWRRGSTLQDSWVSPEYIARGGLSHGYALTIASAQGLTSKTCRALGLGTDAHALYPAMSRVQEEAVLYLPAADLEQEEVQATMGEARTENELLDRALTAYKQTLTDPDDGMIIDTLDRVEPRDEREPLPEVTLEQAQAGQGPTMRQSGADLEELWGASERARQRAEDLHVELVELNERLQDRRWFAGPLTRQVERTQDSLEAAREEQRHLAREAQALRQEAIDADMTLARHQQFQSQSAQPQPVRGRPGTGAKVPTSGEPGKEQKPALHAAQRVGKHPVP